MNDPSAPLSMEAEAPAPAAIDSPGRALAQARQARNIEVIRIASELRLKPETVEALERDDFDNLPSPVFVAGYLRGYARLLGMDPDPLIARFRSLHPHAEAPPPRASANLGREVGGGHLFMRLVSLVVVVTIVGGVAVWWSNRMPDGLGTEWEEHTGVPASDDADAILVDIEPPSEAPPSEPAGPKEPLLDEADPGAGSEPAPELASKPAALITPESPNRPTPAPEPTQAPPPVPVAEITGIADTEVVATETTPAPNLDKDAVGGDTAPPEPPGTVQTELRFTGPCWVDVRDSAGKSQLFGEMAKGDRHVLEGTPPYSLILGNAAAVELEVGGRPFDVRAIAKGNVARFELDPAAEAARNETDAGVNSGATRP